jgi:MFS family permease
MKTSPELLSSILQVLTKIEKKMGGESAEPKPAFSDLITGKRSLKDVFKKKPSVEENTIKALSLGVEQLNKELGKVDIEKLKSIYEYSNTIKNSYIALSNDLKGFSDIFIQEISPSSIFGDLTRDKIIQFKENVATSTAAIFQLNNEIQNLNAVPLDKLYEIGGALSASLSQIDVLQLEEFRAHIQSFADSTKNLSNELKDLDAQSLSDMGKFSVTPIHKDSLISVLLGNTSLKQWAMLRSNVGVIKKMSENLDILSSSADKLSSSLAEIKFGEFDTLIHLLDKSVDDKSIFGSETSKNILTVSEKIKILYENTKEFNKQLTRIDVDTVNDLVQIVSQPLDKTSIFSSLTSSIVTKFSNSMDKASVAVERLMKQFSGANVKDFKQFIDVLNSKMKKDSFFEFLGNYKTNLEFGNNLTSFVDSLRKLNEELKPLENLNLKDLSAFKDLIVITGKDFDKNALLSEKKSATVKDNLFLIAHGLYALNTELANLDIDKLKELSTNIDKLEMPSKKPTFKEKVSGFAHVAKETSMAVAYMGLALVAFGGALVVTSQLLQVNPLGVLGFVVLTSVAMAASMAILAGGSAGGDRLGRIFGKDIGIEESGKKSYTKEGIENAKGMGIALTYIAGGIGMMALSLVATKAILGTTTVLGGVSAVVLTVVAMTGVMALLGATAVITEVGIKASKDMGKAMMYMSGGILSFAITIALVPKILGINKGPEEGDFGTRKGWVGATAGVASVFLVIGGIVGVFALLGAAAPLITTGTVTAATIAGVMGLMSLAVLAVAFSSKILLSLFSKGTDKRPDGTDRGVIGKALATMGNVVAGLGTFGLFVLSTVGLLWGLGLPVVSAPTLIGAVTLLGVSTALIMTAKSIKRVQEAMEGVEPSALKLNIANMVDAVLNGIIRGITGDPNATVQDNRLDLDRGDIVQFRRVKRVLKIFGNIAGSLSKFASGLRAFSKVGEIASLEYIEDAEGNLVPKIDDSKKIHVTHIAQSIADTFGLFLNSLINNTQNLTRTQARSLKILSRSLVGKKGLISGISEFAETIDTFSKFGAKGEIFVRNEETGQGVHVPITTIVTNITKAFTLFVQGLVGKETMFRREGELGRRMHTFKKTIMGKKGMLSGISDFSDTLRTFAELGATGKMTFIEYDAKGDPIIDPKELKNKPITITSIVKNIVSAFSKFATEMGNEAPNFNIGGSSRTQMDKLTKALMGEKKSRGREKSGLLAGILAFSETIQKFADYGEDGKIPRLDANGQIIPGSKPIDINLVTKGIVASITKFVSSLETQLKGVDLTGADRIDTKLKSFSKVIDTLDKMSKSSDGIDRISASIGSMAQNVQLLVESMGKLDVSKFESFSVAAATAAKSAPAPTSSGTRGGTITQSTADQTAQWNQMAETIGNKIAEKITAGFLNGEFNFTFYNSTGGKLEISNA